MVGPTFALGVVTTASATPGTAKIACRRLLFTHVEPTDNAAIHARIAVCTALCTVSHV
jgi:hypothetical protein